MVVDNAPALGEVLEDDGEDTFFLPIPEVELPPAEDIGRVPAEDMHFEVGKI
jgi:hypothetical protein